MNVDYLFLLQCLVMATMLTGYLLVICPWWVGAKKAMIHLFKVVHLPSRHVWLKYATHLTPREWYSYAKYRLYLYFIHKKTGCIS